MVLLVYAIQPAASTPTFPAVEDTFLYELHANYKAVNTTGPSLDYNIDIDVTHTIQNTSNDFYWANLTTTFNGPSEIFGPLTGNTTWTAFCHEYASAGEIRRLWDVTDLDWTDFSTGYSYDLFFIPQQTLPGDWLWFGTGNDVGDYSAYAVQVEQGETHILGNIDEIRTYLDTVMVGIRYDDHLNATHYPAENDFEHTGWFNMTWEWSLGFLVEISFDIYENLNPNHPSNNNITSVDIEGYMRLVYLSTQDSPLPMPDPAAAAATMNLILGLAGGVVLGLLIGIIIAYLMWKRGK
jgi:hypothetical protein